jgi:hypothetical protein
MPNWRSTQNKFLKAPFLDGGLSRKECSKMCLDSAIKSRFKAHFAYAKFLCEDTTQFCPGRCWHKIETA